MTMPPTSCSGPCWRSGARGEALVKHVLERLDPTAMLARVAKPWLAVVLANNLPRAGKGGAVPLKLEDFVGSVERLAWAKANGCQWNQGLTLVHLSAQLEPCLSQENTLHSLNTP